MLFMYVHLRHYLRQYLEYLLNMLSDILQKAHEKINYLFENQHIILLLL